MSGHSFSIAGSDDARRYSSSFLAISAGIVMHGDEGIVGTSSPFPMVNESAIVIPGDAGVADRSSPFPVVLQT